MQKGGETILSEERDDDKLARDSPTGCTASPRVQFAPIVTLPPLLGAWTGTMYPWPVQRHKETTDHKCLAHISESES